MSSATDDDTVLPDRWPFMSGGLDKETVLPSQNATGIHVPGDVIDNRYTVIREIGRGGMGVVYEVEDRITTSRYAVKRLLPAAAENEHIVRAFVKEGTVAERFSASSGHFVTTKSIGKDAIGYYSVMELIRVPTLRQVLKSFGRIEPEVAFPILLQLASALSVLHAADLIHRDLKPENIFVSDASSNPAIKLVDFGLTRDVSSHTMTGLGGAGTLRYMAPELFRDEPATQASDVYAFGVIAYELLTGELPSIGESLTDYVHDVRAEMVSIVMQCLSSRPERRPRNGSELFSSLRIEQSQSSSQPGSLVTNVNIAPRQSRWSTLRFPNLQVGSKVVIDGKTVPIGAEYTCEIDTGASKTVSVVVTWEDVDLFRGSVDLSAGDFKEILTSKAFRLDCAVPEWCEIRDSAGNRIDFPIKEVLPKLSSNIVYSLVYKNKVFDEISFSPRQGVQQLDVGYGLGKIRVTDLPTGFKVYVDGTFVNGQYSSPIRIDKTEHVFLEIRDQNETQVHTKFLALVAGDSRTIQYTGPIASTVVNFEPSQRTGVHTDATAPRKVQSPTTTSGPNPTVEKSHVLSVDHDSNDHDKKRITRRILIGGGVASALWGGAYLVSKSQKVDRTRTEPIKIPHVASYLQDYPELSSYVNSLCSIPNDRFQMGSQDGKDDEQPVHTVELSAYRMGSSLVTVSLWNEYCASTGTSSPMPPAWGLIDDHPIVNVSWNDIMGADGNGGFCAWASEIAGFPISLPTEAQFEYACCGGSERTEFPWGDRFDANKLWYLGPDVEDTGKTASVTRKSSFFRNAFGMTDICGNVWQWCKDYYAPYTSSSVKDPEGLSQDSENFRSLRGGSWLRNEISNFRCTSRWKGQPDLRLDDYGFRLCAPAVT